MITDDEIFRDVQSGAATLMARLPLCETDAAFVRMHALTVVDEVDEFVFAEAMKGRVKDPALAGQAVLALALQTLCKLHAGCMAQEEGL